MTRRRESINDRSFQSEISLLSQEDRLGNTTSEDAEQYDEHDPLTLGDVDEGEQAAGRRGARRK